MRKLLFLLASMVPMVAACKDAEAFTPPESGSGFAVVELFTSEGCSSCPPAEDVFSGWVKKNNPRIFPLAFHVDYWDDLGWVDPYSSAPATARQREYAASFGTSSVFTPQMIVGGTEGFVGSDSSTARAAIGRAFGRASSAKLTLTADPEGAQGVRVHYHVDSPPNGVVLRLALVEHALVSRVLRGENAGRTLEHENVVRSFVSVPLGAADGTATLTVPVGVDRARAEVIGYVQVAAPTGGRGLPIVAAARTAAPRAR